MNGEMIRLVIIAINESGPIKLHEPLEPRVREEFGSLSESNERLLKSEFKKVYPNIVLVIGRSNRESGSVNSVDVPNLCEVMTTVRELLGKYADVNERWKHGRRHQCVYKQ